MSIWMYHTLTKSVYPVSPASTAEQAAVLADKLPHRIFFEAELTTQPIVFDSYRVLDPHRGWFKFVTKEDLPDIMPEGCVVYRVEVRDLEVFMIGEKS